MISKSTRTKLIKQLSENGTLSSSAASNLITKEAVKAPVTVAIARVLAHNHRAPGERWLASSVHQVMLP